MKATCFLLALVLFFGIAASACVNNCSGHGNCVNNACNCTIGYGGSDCSIFDREIQSGQTLTGHLNTFQWHYYHIALPNDTASLYINATQTSSFGDIDMYVGRNYYPDTTHYIYKDQTTAREIIAEITPATAGVYYIGLYGYWSSDYSITVRAMLNCPVNCGPHGYCSGSQCVCNEPYTGEDCSIYDLAIKSGNTYSDSVENSKWMYYHLNVAQGNYLDIEVTQTTGGSDLDLYVRHNERPTTRAFNYVNATIDPVTVMHLQNLEAGVWEIGVYGYVGGSYTIRAITGVAPTCVNNCSNHGTCQSGKCVCNTDYSGDSCDTYERDMNLGQTYVGLVQTSEWNFWHIRYFTQGSLKISVQQTTQDGDCDTYIRSGQNPNRVAYQMADLTVSDSYSLIIQNPGNETWFIGVFGWVSSSYEISVSLIDDCQCTAGSHGSCSKEGSTQCVCEIGWAGSTCEEASTQLTSGLIWSEQYAPFDEWQYYYFVSDSMAVSITMVEAETEGSLWLFVSMSGYPYGENYDYYDISATSFHEVQVAWLEPRTQQESRMYFIGVVSSTISVVHEPVEFAITVYGTPF